MIANAESLGCYFADYSPEGVRALARNTTVGLTPAERLGLLGNEWWMVRSGRHDIDVFLEHASARI